MSGDYKVESRIELGPIHAAEADPAEPANTDPLQPKPVSAVLATPESEVRRSPRSAMGSSNAIVPCVLVVVGVAALLLVILLPLSFSALEYYEYGFVRRKSTGVVSTGKVYESGRHAVGPDSEFKIFPANAHFETFERVTVFAADRLQVTVTAHMQYFLRPHQLHLLHKKFDIYYKPVLKNNALDALKGAATMFATREYIAKRDQVEQGIFRAVRDRLGGRCCERDCESEQTCLDGCLEYSRCAEDDFGLFAQVRYFQLTRLDVPSELEERNLRALVLEEETEAEQFRQDAQVVRKETEGLVRDIMNRAKEISENAQSQSSLMRTSSTANATAIVEQARVRGLRHLYDEIGLKSKEHRASFDYLRTIMEKKDIRLAVDFDQLIAGPLDKF